MIRLGEIIPLLDLEKIGHFLPRGGESDGGLAEALTELAQGERTSEPTGLLGLARSQEALYPVIIEGPFGNQSVRPLRSAPPMRWPNLVLDTTATAVPMTQVVALCLLEWVQRAGAAAAAAQATAI